MYKILIKLDCPPKFVNLVRHVHEGINAEVISKGKNSESFVVQTEVKQGCVFSTHSVCSVSCCNAK